MAGWFTTPGGSRKIILEVELLGKGHKILDPHALDLPALRHRDIFALNHLYYEESTYRRPEMLTIFLPVAISRRKSIDTNPIG